MESPQLLNDWNLLKGSIGLFGGTFDPVQKAHLSIADVCLQTRKVDSVVFIPAKQNPLKTGDPGATGPDRLAMLQRALKDKENLFISDIELVRENSSRSFTIDTVIEIKGKLKNNQRLVFIMGSDCLQFLPRWNRVHDLVGLLDGFIIYPRGYDPSHAAKQLELHFSKSEIDKVLKDKLIAPELAFSATDVRARIKKKESISGLVPVEIEEYIKSHQLYL